MDIGHDQAEVEGSKPHNSIENDTSARKSIMLFKLAYQAEASDVAPPKQSPKSQPGRLQCTARLAGRKMLYSLTALWSDIPVLYHTQSVIQHTLNRHSLEIQQTGRWDSLKLKYKLDKRPTARVRSALPGLY